MAWRYLASRQPEAIVELPEQGAEPLACHLNHVVAVMDFEGERGEQRSVEFTSAMDRRARDLEMKPEDYVIGLLGFADKAAA